MDNHHVTCKSPAEYLDQKTVEFQYPTLKGPRACGIGCLLARSLPSGRMVIKIETRKPEWHLFTLYQPAADRIEVNSSEETDYICIIPDFEFCEDTPRDTDDSCP